ncbi:MAG: hypothetical protein ABSB75_04060, partial [Candidatus Limnocylindrales bacterium]
MRNGHKPRREHVIDTTENPIGLPEVEPPKLKALPSQPAADEPGMQLGLDSLDPFDEPDEVLVHFSTEALDEDAGLGGEEDDEVEAAAEPEVVAEAEPQAAEPAEIAEAEPQAAEAAEIAEAEPPEAAVVAEPAEIAEAEPPEAAVVAEPA